MYSGILRVELPAPLRRRFEFFCSQFEFCEPAGEQLEYKTKDTARLAGADLSLLLSTESGKDRVADLGSQTRAGISVRALMTLLIFSKALAYFRGKQSVELADLRQIVPFVLQDKLSQNADSPFFEAPGHSVYRTDRISWIRKLFDLACADYDRLNLDNDDPVAALSTEFDQGLEGVSAAGTRARLVRIERLLADLAKGSKLYGHLYDDLLKLKYLHQRYTNYLKWLESPQ